MNNSEEKLKIRFNLIHDWNGRFAFDNQHREIINEIIEEVLYERERIKKLPWYKRLNKDY